MRKLAVAEFCSDLGEQGFDPFMVHRLETSRLNDPDGASLGFVVLVPALCC
jgi:hypothetical protein